MKSSSEAVQDSRHLNLTTFCSDLEIKYFTNYLGKFIKYPTFHTNDNISCYFILT